MFSSFFFLNAHKASVWELHLGFSKNCQRAPQLEFLENTFGSVMEIVAIPFFWLTWMLENLQELTVLRYDFLKCKNITVTQL